MIIVAGLTEPPTETLPFRHVTAVSKCDYKMDVLVESPQKMKDLYWRFMKGVGMLDYVEYIITPKERVCAQSVRFHAALNIISW